MQTKQSSTGLVWFKNNLRVQDNLVLNSAINNNSQVLAVYVFEFKNFELTEFGFKKTEKFRAQFLIESIENLKQNLKTLNIELFVYVNNTESHLKTLIESFNVRSVYLQKEWTFEECIALEKVKKAVSKPVVFHELYDQFLYEPDGIYITIKNIPEVFTNFRKKLEKYGTVMYSLENHASQTQKTIENPTKIPTLNDLGFESFEMHENSAFPFKGGENQALERLNAYFFKTKHIKIYKTTRNGLIGTEYSSKFSPWLANGCLSARTIYWELKKFEKEYVQNESTYWLIFELIWRDFFKYISLKHGNRIFKIDGILKNSYHWKTNHTLIQLWIDGKTNSNFVNANMLELKKTGWMSNRGRQNVASFFAKNLKLDWRIGAAYFESFLIDYDVHSNYGNWMYVAGVGNDPRDRVFNVALQAERYDAHGKFQNLWLQETLF
ncbi:DASH family cryptochrome [Yeosuana sp. AK3]